MIDLSFAEILVVLLVGLLVMKPEDIGVVFRKIMAVKKYLVNLKDNFYKNFIAEFDNDGKQISELQQDLDVMNKYLSEIIAKEGEYKGEYDIVAIKEHYSKLTNDNKPAGKQCKNTKN